MELSKDINEKIQQLQSIEKNMQNLIMEKQNLQIELNGISNALSELKTSSDEVYRIIEGLMIKAEKKSLVKELNDKKNVFEIKLSAIEKQEKSSEEKISTLRDEINSKISAKGNKEK